MEWRAKSRRYLYYFMVHLLHFSRLEICPCHIVLNCFKIRRKAKLCPSSAIFRFVRHCFSASIHANGEGVQSTQGPIPYSLRVFPFIYLFAFGLEFRLLSVLKTEAIRFAFIFFSLLQVALFCTFLSRTHLRRHHYKPWYMDLDICTATTSPCI